MVKTPMEWPEEDGWKANEEMDEEEEQEVDEEE
jgi:hypothetical protein